MSVHSIPKLLVQHGDMLAGAGRVYMVEQGQILGFAREFLRDNGRADQ